MSDLIKFSQMADPVFLDLSNLQGKEGNFRNLQWENSHDEKNPTISTNNLKISRKDCGFHNVYESMES